jgi:hypothetical protein
MKGLDQIRDYNSQMFVDHFKEALGEKFDITCNWAFPVMELQFKTKDPNNVVIWKFNIDVIKPDYTIQTYGSKKESDVETPQFATIDKIAIEFIVSRSIMLSHYLFPNNDENDHKNNEKNEESTEESTEQLTEESTEETPN